MNSTKFHRYAVPAVLLLLGAQYVLGGLNWWIKLFPFPNYFDEPTGPGKHAVLDAMIATGWMFTSAKIVELLTGVALLTRRYIPLMLVVAFPVAITTFIIDALIFDDLVAWLSGEVSGSFMWSRVMDLVFFGGAVLAMHGYLMLAYLPYYRPMFVRKADLSGGDRIEQDVTAPGSVSKLFNGLLVALGLIAIVLGILSTFWLIGMVDQWLIPWSSLALTAPPR